MERVGEVKRRKSCKAEKIQEKEADGREAQDGINNNRKNPSTNNLNNPNNSNKPDNLNKSNNNLNNFNCDSSNNNTNNPHLL